MGTVNSREPIQSFQNEVSGPCSFPVSAFVSHQCATSVLRGASSVAAFTTAGGLVLSSAAGATLATIPTAALVAGKVLLAKKAVVGGALLANALSDRDQNT